jgi:hypothetical protein
MKCIHKFFLFILFSIVLSLKATAEQSLGAETKKSNQQSDDLEITVLVHGILSIKQSVNPQNMIKFVRDKIADTSYARSTELTRKNPFFYQHHPMQGLGLRKIDLSTEEKGAAATAFAQTLGTIYHQIGNYSEKVYYTFGWSGLLSPRMRYLEAKIFYEHMLKEFSQYYGQKRNIKLRIIGYSHGGNVTLKLAEIYKKEGIAKENKIIIDELILIGVPVLSETDYLVNSSLFKKIYHFYSYGDRVQRLDCFSLNRMFSNRLFHERYDFKLPDKLVQVNVRLKRPVQGKGTVLLQENPDKAVHKKRLMRTADPGHTELWSFGWTPASYRKQFPLHPLPLTAFTPFIIHSLEQCAQKSKSLSVELHPFLERMLVYDYQAKKEMIMPFVSKEQLATLKEKIKNYMPENFTKEIFNAHLKFAKRKARQQWLTEHNIRRFGHHKSSSFVPAVLQELPNS